MSTASTSQPIISLNPTSSSLETTRDPVEQIKDVFGDQVSILLSKKSVSLMLDGYGIGYIIMNRPDKPVNVIDETFLRDLNDVITFVNTSKSLKTVVFFSLKKVFMAGADIKSIYPVTDNKEAMKAAQAAQQLFNKVEKIKIPTIAAIRGAALGGGLELALACSHRIAADSKSTMLGLPEVQLGLIPGAGGCWRLPKLIGLTAALQLILPGKSVNALKAKKLGLVDKVVEGSDSFTDQNIFLLGTKRYAMEILAKFTKRKVKNPRQLKRSKPKPLTSKLMEENCLGQQVVEYMTLKNLNKLTRGKYPAPYAALSVILANYKSTNMTKGLEREAEAFGNLAVTPESKSLTSIFFLREAAKKCPIHSNNPDFTGNPNKIGVIGAGVMGSAIAQLANYKGYEVHMKDIKDEFINRGMQNIKSLYSSLIKRKRITPYELSQKMQKLTASTLYSGFEGSQIIIEAAVENLKIKKIVLAQTEKATQIDGHIPIFATNTSSLSITAIAADAQHPEKVVGMHFFSPVAKMPLVEIIRGEQTDDETAIAVYNLALKMGKTPVIVGDGPGFLVNRLLGIYLSEANHILMEGGSIKDIDSALTSFGMPMGPFRLMDEVGLDICGHVAAILEKGLGKTRFGRIQAYENLVANSPVFKNRLGKKGGAGFYKYHPKTQKSQGIDSNVQSSLDSFRKRKKFDSATIIDRCVLVMVNEACHILQEKIADSPETVDLAMVFGTGFAPFRGGLLSYADSIGIHRILSRLTAFSKTHGPRFQPCPLIVSMASSSSTFFPDRPVLSAVNRSRLMRKKTARL